MVVWGDKGATGKKREGDRGGYTRTTYYIDIKILFIYSIPQYRLTYRNHWAFRPNQYSLLHDIREKASQNAGLAAAWPSVPMNGDKPPTGRHTNIVVYPNGCAMHCHTLPYVALHVV